MTQRVQKYLIPATPCAIVNMPHGAVILQADTDEFGQLCLFAMVDNDQANVAVLISVYTTGEPVAIRQTYAGEDHVVKARYINSVVTPKAAYHVFRGQS